MAVILANQPPRNGDLHRCVSVSQWGLEVRRNVHGENTPR